MSVAKPFALLALTVAGLAAASPAFADCGGSACSDVLVERIWVKGTGEIGFRTTADESLLTECEYNGYLHLKTDHPAFREIYIAALTAQVADQPLTFRVVAGSGNRCDVLYIVSDK